MLLLLTLATLQPSETAEEILASMSAAYRSCETYADTGVVSSVFEAGDETGEPSVRTIRTLFVRPDHIRFECHEKNAATKAEEYFVVWRGATKSHTWWSTIANGTHHDTPLEALGEASALSGGASDLVYALLSPPVDGKGWSVAQLASLKKAGTEQVTGALCDVLVGKGFEDSAVTVWIDRDSHAIRRFREAVVVPGGTTVDTVTLVPVFGAPVTPEEAWFKPPIVRDPPPVGGDTGGGGAR
ncbi:MAG: hypothetical protein M9921_00140 [Fimbriimonadaceae bacterium]|nr:hypothetical protein [Fimbriimonadaceae bacterium]